jgi:pimeloyl-ACP methyl ester carboxylesterase
MRLVFLRAAAALLVVFGSSVSMLRAAEQVAAPKADTVAQPKPPLVLLIGGMTYDLAKPEPVFGQVVRDVDGETASETYTGMLGTLMREGYRYGGIVTARGGKIELPSSLTIAAATNKPDETAAKTKAEQCPTAGLCEADLFMLEYSPAAQVDGLGIKALELAECIKQLRRATGRSQVQIVAYSAGGIVARTYLQSALPGLEYAGDVRSLVTISTPHMGSDVANHFGDWLGTRATSLQPGAPLIAQLNSELDLPKDVRFASIVVRGLGADLKGEGETFESLVDNELLDTLPLDYRRGGDQVVHVRSQNLALTPTARRYVAATKRPVEYLSVRVVDPSPSDCWPCQATVHEVAAGDAEVQQAVRAMLVAHRDDSTTTERREARAAAVAAIGLLHARCRALSAVEAAADDEHPCCQVVASSDLALADFRREANQLKATFTGTARSRGPMRIFYYTTKVKGELTLELDDLGRPRNASHSVTLVDD